MIQILSPMLHARLIASFVWPRKNPALVYSLQLKLRLYCIIQMANKMYLFQTTSQAEVEDWITCLHCGKLIATIHNMAMYNAINTINAAAAVSSTQKDKDRSFPVLMVRIIIYTYNKKGVLMTARGAPSCKLLL